jgi:hypothetical protein
MSISDRFREIHRDVRSFQASLDNPQVDSAEADRAVLKAVTCLAEWADQVGDIPRMHLEIKLTPVLLKAHNHLDRGRLIFEERGMEDLAAACWALQQKIYRLLNDL